MRSGGLLFALFLLLSSAAVFADDGNPFKEIHKEMKKATKSVHKNAKRGAKTIDKSAKKTWKKAGHDIKKATKD